VAIDFAARKSRAVTYLGGPETEPPPDEDVMSRYMCQQDLEVSDCNQIAQEQLDFVACVRSHAQPCVPGTAGRDAIGLAEQILESIARHEWDGHGLGRIGPHALPADAILRHAAWPNASKSQPPRRAAG
jgi:hypothetical protein